MKLVIGYGNTLRGDDGVGPFVALHLSQEHPDWEILTPHQLTPELAETLSRAEYAVFIDASVDGQTGDIACQTLSAQDDGSLFTHHVSPQALLAGAETLYGTTPQAWLVTVTGEEFEYGEWFSSGVKGVLTDVRYLVERLLNT